MYTPKLKRITYLFWGDMFLEHVILIAICGNKISELLEEGFLFLIIFFFLSRKNFRLIYSKIIIFFLGIKE
jgi:hypothetical protein